MNKLIVAFNSDADPKINLSCGYAFGGNGITGIMDLLDAADREMYLGKKKNISCENSLLPRSGFLLQ